MHLSSMSFTSHKLVELAVHLAVALGHLLHLGAKPVVLQLVGGVLKLRRQKLGVGQRVVHIEKLFGCHRKTPFQIRDRSGPFVYSFSRAQAFMHEKKKKRRPEADRLFPISPVCFYSSA